MTDRNEEYREQRIPIIEETIGIERREVETGRVRVQTFVDEENLLLRANLLQTAISVDRVAIGEPIDIAPDVREEGDVLIIPVVEERLVVEKRLFLIEELRVRRSSAVQPVEIPATRRVMRAEVDHVATDTPNPKEART